jgi:hypothetical protein
MASSGKKKTTMAKLNREAKMRERRLDKQARREARKLAAQSPAAPDDTLAGPADESFQPDDSDRTAEAGVPALVDG